LGQQVTCCSSRQRCLHGLCVVRVCSALWLHPPLTPSGCVRCRYRAKPHWGKNFDRTFTHPRCKLSGLYGSTSSTGGFPALKRLQVQHDPKGAFVSPLLRRVLAGTTPSRTAGCAFRGECYCSANSHCARDYSCVSSDAFPQYKVCKPSAWLSG
jgi:hypothetical protein